MYSCQNYPEEVKVSGRVERDRVHIGSKIGGRVSQIDFEEGQAAEAGDVIVVLEQDELNAQLAQAIAEASQAKSRLELLEAGTRQEDILEAEALVAAQRAELDLRQKGFRTEEIKEAQAQLESVQSNLELAEQELKRANELFQVKSIGQQELEMKQNAFRTAKAAADIAEQRLRLIQSGSRPEEIAMAEAQLQRAEAQLARLRNGPRPEEISASRAAWQAAQANVARIQTQLEETEIRAPMKSIVEILDLQPGDLVQPGQTIATLLLMEAPYVRCYVPENQLGYVHLGQKVKVTVDTFPDKRFSGNIQRIYSEAEFTPRNVQTQEKRAELVFEMKVYFLEGIDLVRAGMYADIYIPTNLQKP